jgi:oxygen-independent coproporphyrinogen-3 oxidase
VNVQLDIDSPDRSVAVYVHIPFCPTKCGYCDFNSYAMQGNIVDRTVDAIVQEIMQSPHRGRKAKTIFFGGGTPTYLEEAELLRIFEAVLAVHPPIESAEITSEANPGTVDAAKFAAMRNAGFNRISLGAQSFLDSDLLTLGRIHRSGEIERAVGAAREAGFDNINLDLMFGLPQQSMIGWKNNMERALSLQPEHLSLYCLTIEQNTAFYKMQLRGQLDLPDDEAQVTMYEMCLDRSFEAGYAQYEISNFALPGRECRHNLCYWHAEEYAGYGPGAVGAMDFDDNRVRYTNLKHPDAYCSAVEAGRPLPFESEVLTEATLRVERIMLGLRMNDGLETSGLDLPPVSVQKLLSRGWIEVDAERIRLTRSGRHFCSEVALELI